MEIVKQYLEKRIEQLTIILTKENYEYHADVRDLFKIQSVITELEQILTLFNEEYEKQDKKINSMRDYVDPFQRDITKQSF